jgi:hypothetical protein
MICAVINGGLKSCKPHFCVVRNFAKCDAAKLAVELMGVPWSVLETFEDVDDRWECWKKLFLEVLNSHIPLRKLRVRRKSLPWVDEHIRELMKKRTHLQKLAKKTKQEEDWDLYRQMRNKVFSEMRQAKRKYFEKIGHEAKGKPRKIWQELSRLTGSGRKDVVEVKTVDGVISDNSRILDEFSKYFDSIVGVENGNVDVDAAVRKIPRCNYQFCFRKIESDEVLKVLKELNVKKAVGADEISAKVLVFSAEGIAASLASIFNYSLESGKIPLEWKLANVTPVHKGGRSVEVGNFRPISILPVVSKVFERIIHQQLYDYLQKHSILHPVQSGFRPNHTTQDVLVGMVDVWRKALDENKLVGAVMIDLSKAFDSVNHTILLKKLERYGVIGTEGQWFKSYLADRKQRVCVTDGKSKWTDVRQGVPQGSILGPLLFILYVNDLPLATSHCHMMQYADDTTLYCEEYDSAVLRFKLEEDLRDISRWVEVNQLKLNVGKTQLFVPGRKGRAKDKKDVQVSLNGELLSRSATVKCLGVAIDEGLTWKDHVASMRRKCFGCLAKLRVFSNVLPTTTKKNMFSALVLPHLDYCSTLWMECSQELQKKVEQIQNYGMRLILSKPPRSPSDDLRKTLGWSLLSTRRRVSRLALVQRCLNKNGPIYMQDSFKTNQDMHGVQNYKGLQEDPYCTS